jgi:hypothetical protein
MEFYAAMKKNEISFTGKWMDKFVFFHSVNEVKCVFLCKNGGDLSPALTRSSVVLPGLSVGFSSLPPGLAWLEREGKRLLAFAVFPGYFPSGPVVWLLALFGFATW